MNFLLILYIYACLLQAYHTDGIIDFVGKLIGSYPTPNLRQCAENSEFSQITIQKNTTIPNNLIYLDLFNHLTSLIVPVIPVAIYRAGNFLQNQLPYLVTNPLPNMPIVAGDTVILLGKVPERKLKSEKKEANPLIKVK